MSTREEYNIHNPAGHQINLQEAINMKRKNLQTDGRPLEQVKVL